MILVSELAPHYIQENQFNLGDRQAMGTMLVDFFRSSCTADSFAQAAGQIPAEKRRVAFVAADSTKAVVALRSSLSAVGKAC